MSENKLKWNKLFGSQNVLIHYLFDHKFYWPTIFQSQIMNWIYIVLYFLYFIYFIFAFFNQHKINLRLELDSGVAQIKKIAPHGWKRIAVNLPIPIYAVPLMVTISKHVFVLVITLKLPCIGIRTIPVWFTDTLFVSVSLLVILGKVDGVGINIGISISIQTWIGIRTEPNMI